MVLTSFNQKAYEKDLYEEGVEDGIKEGIKKGIKRGLRRGLILVVLKWLRKLPYVYSSPATPWSKLLS